MADYQINQPYQKPPENYMVWAILSTIFCCMPLGIVSIVKASQVNSRFTSGDYIGAESSSKEARKWAIITAIVGVVIYVLYIIVLFALGGLAVLQNLQQQ
ncbi:MAG: CD225/dispanin family protein [Niabella sp.]